MRDVRLVLAGALFLPVIAFNAIAVSVLHWPRLDETTTLARIAESLVPQLLALAFLGAVAIAVLGFGRWAAILGAATLLCAAVPVTRHLAQSQPMIADRPADLKVLWFNVLGTNTTDPAILAQALIDSPAEVIVLGEAQPLQSQIARLAAEFPAMAGCDEGHCDMLVLSRRPVDRLQLSRVGRTLEQRQAAITLTLPGRAPLTILAVHLIKPWFFGFSEASDWNMMKAVAVQNGPLVMMGDFNAAPWSARLQLLVRDCGMELPRRPVPTWPAGAGWAGVPIDHVMTRDGARRVSLDAWGEGLGSNHRGILAGIVLPQTAPAAPARPGCTPDSLQP